MRHFHVTSTLNRQSILRHGLDWRRMGAAPGIAGSNRPEVEGIFLCTDEGDSEYFVRLNNTGGPVDVWAVDGVDASSLVESSSGYSYLPVVIPPGSLSIMERDR